MAVENLVEVLFHLSFPSILYLNMYSHILFAYNREEVYSNLLEVISFLSIHCYYNGPLISPTFVLFHY